MLYLFTISPQNITDIWAYAGGIITDATPLLGVFMAVGVGLLVLTGVMRAIKH